MKAQKQRLDKIIYELKFKYAVTMSKAQSLIMSGCVYVNGNKIDKCGSMVDVSSEFVVKNKKKDFVSRGGTKLECAIKIFNIDVKDKICMDVGASTGGFTDCLLQNGAQKVFAVDVGYGQMDLKIKNNNRVKVIDRQNVRELDFTKIGTKFDIITCDVSFISLTKISKKIREFLKDNGDLILLIKPQFELKREEVDKGGVIKNREKINMIVENVIKHYVSMGFVFQSKTKSPILGHKGNEEWLVYFKCETHNFV